MKYPKFLLFALSALLVILLTGCTAEKPVVPTQTNSDLVVITSISPLADLIKNVGGDKISLVSLVKPGSDPHDFEPKPDDVKKVASARVFFANGAGEEPYLDKLVKNAGSPNLKIVTLSEGLEILGKGSGEYSTTGNPHLWLDVENAKAYVIKIRDNLSEVSPQNKAYFADNATKYLSRLDDLDKEIKQSINSIPERNRKMVVFHNAWAYFAKRYGLELKALVESSEGEPSAKEYAELITYIRENNVKAVFGEAGFNPKLTKQLAEETGADFVDNLYDDTVAESGDPDSYLAMMKMNTDRIVKALK